MIYGPQAESKYEHVKQIGHDARQRPTIRQASTLPERPPHYNDPKSFVNNHQKGPVLGRMPFIFFPRGKSGYK